jgi:ankyrin repeat protein
VSPEQKKVIEGGEMRPIRFALWFFLPLLLGSCAKTPETPQEELAARNISFTEAAFLHSAASGDVTAVNLFLAAGMDPNVKDQVGGTALRYAAAKGHLAIVQALLDKGAEVNVQDNDGFTPLRYAAYYGHTAVVQALLKKGADVNVKDRWGWTPLMVASHGNLEIFELLKAAEAQR